MQHEETQTAQMLVLRKQQVEITELAIAGKSRQQIADELHLDVEFVQVTLDSALGAATKHYLENLAYLRTLSLLRLERGINTIYPLAMGNAYFDEDGVERTVVDRDFYKLYLDTIKLEIKLIDQMEDSVTGRKERHVGVYAPTVIMTNADDIEAVRRNWMQRYRDMSTEDLIIRDSQEPGKHPFVRPEVSRLEVRIQHETGTPIGDGDE